MSAITQVAAVVNQGTNGLLAEGIIGSVLVILRIMFSVRLCEILGFSTVFLIMGSCFLHLPKL